MIFTPYQDELDVIKMIHKYRNEDYALLRLTFTMIDKNNLDANGILRDLLRSWGLVDYDLLENGGKNGLCYNALFLKSNNVENVTLKFYRVQNSRGDRRFSIETIKRKIRDHEINVGDLLYISVYATPSGQPQIYFLNLTHNTPTEETIMNFLGIDAIASLFLTLKPKLKAIINGDYYNNSKGPGKIAPKDVGDTLEYLLGINTNNRNNADYNGLIEIKSKGDSKTLDTLFTLRPRFEQTRVAYIEPNDRYRVSAFTRLYGYESEKHSGFNSLYITIGSFEAPQNNQGFYLHVDDEHRMVNLIWRNPTNYKPEIAAFWTFDDLKKQLYLKHPSTLWIKATSRTVGNMVQFKYTEVDFSRAPQFTTFLSLIKSGDITYDWRGYTTKTGPYKGKNHGNAWRIKPYAKSNLFGEIESIDF